MVLLEYDTYNVLYDAIISCKGDNPKCIKDALYKVRNKKGVSVIITIDSSGDTLRDFVLRKIENNKLVDLE